MSAGGPRQDGLSCDFSANLASHRVYQLENGDTFQRTDMALPGVCVIQPRVFRDRRGFFLESYHQSKFAALGIREHFVQDNHSRSLKNVLRGLHYQLKHPQAKLCRVVEGKVLDVAVDIRLGSPHWGKCDSVVLSAEEQNQLYIPKGFAHGFLALTESVQFLYKCSDFFDPTDEHGIAWNDQDLGINWGITEPLMSDKDRQYVPLARVQSELLPRYQP